MLSVEQLVELYLQACEVELQAFKPGNVSVYSPAHDMTVEDFRLSARVSAPALCNPHYSLGERIFYAVQATRQTVACNTNLGIILLCAPLIQAVLQLKPEQSLREMLTLVLNNTTIEDANWVYQAIMLASPGGLGSSDQQDVNDTAEVTLLQAMVLASQRDKVAWQYAHYYKDIFDFAVLRYNRGFVWFGDPGWSALVVFCELLAQFPDSHIERKYGNQYSDWLQSEMVALCETLAATEKPEQLLPKLYQLDAVLKAKMINPGTTADLTVAAVLVVFLMERLA